MCVKQLEEGRAEVENHTRAGAARRQPPGAASHRARSSRSCDRKWRGIGEIPASGWGLREPYAEFDAERRFGVADRTVEESTECIAGLILQGVKKPDECPAFGTRCTPEHPLGAPMVSSEGACAAYYRYRGQMKWTSPFRPAPSPSPTTPPSCSRTAAGAADAAAHREDVCCRRSAIPAGRAARRRGILPAAGAAPGLHHRLLRGAAAVLPRRRHRHAGRQRHGERPGHVRRAAALSQRRLHPRGRPADGDAVARGAVHAARRRGRRACRSSPATPRWWTRARATGCSSTPPASA